MTDPITLDFVPLTQAGEGTLVVLAGAGLALSPAGTEALGPELNAALPRAAKAERFEGKGGSSLALLPAADSPYARALVFGTAAKAAKAMKPGPEPLRWGAALAGRLGEGHATVVLDGRDPEWTAQFALGAALRAYRFDAYKTKPPEDGDEPKGALHLRLAVDDVDAARGAHVHAAALAAGVNAARDLVNEPPNLLTPAAFAERLEGLREHGVEVEVLGPEELRELKMGALLGVSLGSAVPPRVVVMRWRGGGGEGAPFAVVGKGVTFDSGGISIKPAAGMEDMKGDMAGAAAVAGLMRALALAKAPVDVVAAVGLVENMPDGAAQRPGDIVTAMSGRTIEIINTDAEGRLVLADVLHLVRERYAPRAMVELSTLTGAILVALGQARAGLFTADDALAAALHAAGEATGERVWRLPMGPEYDELIDSKFADMKNTGGRHAGSITAAQFLARFTGDTPFAHLDVAGVGFGAKEPEWNRSWGPGWGVRLLDRWLRDAAADVA